MISTISLPKVLNVFNLGGEGEGGRINHLFKFTFTMPKVKKKNLGMNSSSCLTADLSCNQKTAQNQKSFPYVAFNFEMKQEC
jgi:hypothetical protein